MPSVMSGPVLSKFAAMIMVTSLTQSINQDVVLAFPGDANWRRHLRDLTSARYIASISQCNKSVRNDVICCELGDYFS